MNPALAYHAYLGPAMFAPMARVTLAAAQPQPGERALDVACGTGIVALQLPPLVGGTGQVVGLDVSPAMLAIAAAQPPPEGAVIDWREGNAMAMDLPAGAFELAICQHGLQFFRDRAAGARELRRVLVPGGRAVVACWQGLEHQPFFASLVRAQARQLGISEAQAGMPFAFGDPEALRGLLVEAGFARVELATHAIEARFVQPEKFLRMTAAAAAVVMPERFAGVDLEPLVAAIAAECADALARHRDGDVLRFPVPANVAVAHAL